MGKGDQKTKRGKIISGSYGKTRLRRPVKNLAERIADDIKKKAEPVEEKKAKPAAKKEVAKPELEEKKAEKKVEAVEEKKTKSSSKKEAAKPEPATEKADEN